MPAIVHPDLYPSRGQQQAGLMDRQDPVVYAAPGTYGPLSQAQIQSYEDNGFLILDDVFTGDQLQALQDELERLRQQGSSLHPQQTITEPGSDDMRSKFQVHLSSPVFRQLAADPRLADVARYLLDDQVYIHQSRLNYKPGFRGKEFYWHSDFETWHVEDGLPRMRALSMSIPLTPNNANNGPLMLIPGSHRQYVICEGETPKAHYTRSLQKQEYGVPGDAQLSQLANSSYITAAHCNPGSVIIFDCNVMHGSNGNITPDPRSNVFFVYNALSNQPVDPFCNQPPRPEHLASRDRIEPLPVNAPAFQA